MQGQDRNRTLVYDVLGIEMAEKLIEETYQQMRTGEWEKLKEDLSPRIERG